jgi:ATP-dependent RNA helicase DDX56/DBP9
MISFHFFFEDHDDGGLLSSSGSKEQSSKKKERKGKKGGNNSHKKDNHQDYGVSRGVDFKEVEAVINFDFPKFARGYTHRIGRTARGGASGMALSLIAPEDMADFGKVEKSQQGIDIKPFMFNMKDVDGFRYRVADAIRAVTRAQVKEARLKEIKREILNSDKLKVSFCCCCFFVL